MKIQIIKYFKQLSITRKVILILITILVIAYIFCLPRQLFHVPYSTVVTDRNGELLGARIASDGQWRFPLRTTTPEKIKQCLITFEDRHFNHQNCQIAYITPVKFIAPTFGYVLYLGLNTPVDG